MSWGGTPGVDKFRLRQSNPISDLIKMDIEGGAGHAVQGMTRLIAAERPIMLIELHGPEEGQAVWDLLLQNGYSMYRMNQSRNKIVAPSQLECKECLIGLPQQDKAE